MCGNFEELIASGLGVGESSLEDPCARLVEAKKKKVLKFHVPTLTHCVADTGILQRTAGFPPKSEH